MIDWKKIRRFTSAAKLLILLSCVGMARICLAQGYAISGQVISSTGRPVSGALVRVCPYTGGGIPCNPTSSLFSDLALTQSIGNPYAADSNGNFSFFAAASSTYIVQLSAGSGATYSYFVTASGTGTGTGTVVSVATTSPLSGGPITTTGTLSCPTCVVSSLPGAGIAHFAGGTQAVTSSPVNLASDVSGQLPNANLANPSVAVNGQTCTLGGTCTIPSGSLTSFAAPSANWPTWLVPTVTNPTTTASLSVALANQSAHIVCVAGPASGSAATPTCRQLTADDIAPGFSITGFGNGATVEIGTTVTNPAFGASYSSTPTSATITNTDGIDSPLNLTSPFTGGTVSGSFLHTSSAAVTFTLTAIGTSTQTANVFYSWEPRSFGGVGTAGATGATASGTTAVLSGATGTLSSLGLTNSNTGATYGPFSPSGQKIYLLIIGGSHTFKDAVTGFAFAFNTPTSISFVNVNGYAVAMFLYESTNTLTGTYSILVAS